MPLIRWEYYAWAAMAIAAVGAVAAFLAHTVLIEENPPYEPAAALYPDPLSPDFTWHTGTIHPFSLETNQDAVLVELPARPEQNAGDGGAYLRFVLGPLPGIYTCDPDAGFPEEQRNIFKAGETVWVAACRVPPQPPDDLPTGVPTPIDLDTPGPEPVEIVLRHRRKTGAILSSYNFDLQPPDPDLTPSPVALQRPLPDLLPDNEEVLLPQEIRIFDDSQGISLEWQTVREATHYQIQRMYCPMLDCPDADWQTIGLVENAAGDSDFLYRDDTLLVAHQPRNHFGYRMRSVQHHLASPWSPPLLSPVAVKASTLRRDEPLNVSWELPLAAPADTEVVVYRRTGAGGVQFAALVTPDPDLPEGWAEDVPQIRDANNRFLVDDVCYHIQLVTALEVASIRTRSVGLIWPAENETMNCLDNEPRINLQSVCDATGVDLTWDAVPETFRGADFTHYTVEYELTYPADETEAGRPGLSPGALIGSDARSFTIGVSAQQTLRIPLFTDQLDSAVAAGAYRADVTITAHYDDNRTLEPSQRYCLTAVAPTPAPVVPPDETMDPMAPGTDVPTEVPTDTATPTDVPTATPTPTISVPTDTVANLMLEGCSLDGDNRLTVSASWDNVPATHAGATFIDYRVSVTLNGESIRVLDVPSLAVSFRVTVDPTIRNLVVVTVAAGYGRSGTVLVYTPDASVECERVPPDTPTPSPTSLLTDPIQPVANLSLDECSLDAMENLLTSISWDAVPAMHEYASFVEYRLGFTLNGLVTSVDPVTIPSVSFRTAVDGSVENRLTVTVAAGYGLGGVASVYTPDASVECVT